MVLGRGSNFSNSVPLKRSLPPSSRRDTRLGETLLLEVALPGDAQSVSCFPDYLQLEPTMEGVQVFL